MGLLVVLIRMYLKVVFKAFGVLVYILLRQKPIILGVFYISYLVIILVINTFKVIISCWHQW